MRKRERERERESVCVCVCVCETEREREVKTGRQAGGFTLLVIKWHKQTKILHVKTFYGFYWKERSAFFLPLLNFPQSHILPFKRINICFLEPLFIRKMYFESI